MSYQKLFEPGMIGNVKVRNRVVMTAMGTGLPTWNGEASDEMIRFYEDRAKGGCGLIIPEFTRVDMESGQCNPVQLCIGDRRYVKSFERMIDAAHRHGAKMFIQLQHGGREAPPLLNGGKQPMAPSAVTNKISGITPKAMTIDEIRYIIDKFVAAAANSQRAGADGVELHAAHGYLLTQFVSPYTNKREDEYGGNVENRCRIVNEILAGIRQVCGARFPVCVRMNGSDFVEGGIEIDYAVECAKLFEQGGAAALNVSCAVYESAPKMIEPNYYAEGWRKYLAQTVKANVDIPVIAVNTIKQPQTAERFLQEGVCDFVGVARGHTADPEWVNKAKRGREELIRRCIGCMNCNKSIVADRYMACAVNPQVGRATIMGDDKLQKDGQGRAVAVVGGGPAGMQAALTLAKRGFKPVLFEKGNQLGGAGILASQPPHKTLVKDLVATQTAEMKEYGVEVRLGAPATVETIKALNPYGVIVATGGLQIVPNLPGVKDDHVYDIEDVLMSKVKFDGKKIAVIGGGIAGLETAHFLCENNNVTVVEMLDIAGAAMYPTARNALLALLREDGVNILTGHGLKAIGKNGVTLTKMATGEEVVQDAEIVILALGNRPDEQLNDMFESAFEHVAFVGDSRSSGTFLDATRSAYDAAFVF